MPILGTLDKSPKYRLERHQIARVICQVRFSPVLRLEQTESVAVFQERLREQFPRYSQERGVTMLVTPQGVSQQSDAPPVHRFADREGRFVLSLGTEFFAIETRHYVDIDELVGHLTLGLGLVDELYEPPEINRAGLRFTNELRFPAESLLSDVRSAINPALLGMTASDALGDAVRSVRAVYLLGADDGSSVQILAGLHADAGTTVEPNDALPDDDRDKKNPFYLIDIDAFDDRPASFAVSTAEAQVRHFNDLIRTAFSWAAVEGFRRAELGQVDL